MYAPTASMILSIIRILIILERCKQLAVCPWRELSRDLLLEARDDKNCHSSQRWIFNASSGPGSLGTCINPVSFIADFMCAAQPALFLCNIQIGKKFGSRIEHFLGLWRDVSPPSQWSL